MKVTLIVIYFVFITYYLFALYVIGNLRKNPCSCKKLEGYKNTWNFKYVLIVTPLLLVGNLYYLYKLLSRRQLGGGTALYYFVLVSLLLGYGLSYLNDYAILNLFSRMKNEHCPCNEGNRDILQGATYGKIAVNSLFLISALVVLQNTRKFNSILKKVKK